MYLLNEIPCSIFDPMENLAQLMDSKQFENSTIETILFRINHYRITEIATGDDSFKYIINLEKYLNSYRYFIRRECTPTKNTSFINE